MSKKFIVEYQDISEFDEDVDCEDVLKFLSSESHQKVLTNWNVTELPIIPEVKRIETGVLMSPMAICGAQRIDFKNKSLFCTCDYIDKRINISESGYSRQCFKDIETTWDFNSIPVGSLIEVIPEDDSRPRVGFNTGTSHPNEIRIESGYGYTFYKSNEIKSIRIIETGEAK